MMLFFVVCAALTARVMAAGDPVLPHPLSMIYEGQARFSVLTTRLIRLEWSPTYEFVDGKTWVVQTRQVQPNPPVFNVTRNDTHLRIDTTHVTLEYLRNVTTTFSQHNIRVTVRINITDGATVSWSAIPGEEQESNLLGTIRTLDDETDSKVQLD